LVVTNAKLSKVFRPQNKMHLLILQRFIKQPYMIIFIKDRPVRILSEKAAQKLPNTATFDKVIDTHLEMLKVASLRGHVLILNATPITVEKLFQLLDNSEVPDLQSIAILPKDKEAIEKRIKKLYEVVKAAGGIVTKNDQHLMMFRRGVWDLPKGKLDDNERSKKAAIREVEEEMKWNKGLGSINSYLILIYGVFSPKFGASNKKYL